MAEHSVKRDGTVLCDGKPIGRVARDAQNRRLWRAYGRAGSPLVRHGSQIHFGLENGSPLGFEARWRMVNALAFAVAAGVQEGTQETAE